MNVRELDEKTLQDGLPEGCRLRACCFAQLTTGELYDLLRTRSEVFIVEQDCVYQDVDNYD